MREVLLLALVIVAGAVVPNASAQAPGDSVTGRATSCDPEGFGCPTDFATTVDLDAHSAPSGENATGTAVWERRASLLYQQLSGPVSCLAVSGKTAIVGFFEIGSSVVATVVIRVTDGGGGAGQDSIESAVAVGSSPPFPDCSRFPPSFPTLFRSSGVNDFGDIVVHDAVADRTPPVLTVPSDITVNAQSLTGTRVTYAATATDDTDPSPEVICKPPSQTMFPIGKTTVTCTATDETGNKASNAFNVIVRLPSSKAECKNGGWRNFGTVFRNQGDCVSFVATKGKNQPSGP